MPNGDDDEDYGDVFAGEARTPELPAKGEVEPEERRVGGSVGRGFNPSCYPLVLSVFACTHKALVQ